MNWKNTIIGLIIVGLLGAAGWYFVDNLNTTNQAVTALNTDLYGDGGEKAGKLDNLATDLSSVNGKVKSQSNLMAEMLGGEKIEQNGETVVTTTIEPKDSLIGQLKSILDTKVAQADFEARNEKVDDELGKRVTLEAFAARNAAVDAGFELKANVADLDDLLIDVRGGERVVRDKDDNIVLDESGEPVMEKVRGIKKELSAARSLAAKAQARLQAMKEAAAAASTPEPTPEKVEAEPKPEKANAEPKPNDDGPSVPAPAPGAHGAMADAPK